MNEKIKKRIKIGASISVGVLISLFVLLSRRTQIRTIGSTAAYAALCDAFFAPAMLYAAVFLFRFVTQEGVFDGLVFALKKVGAGFKRQVEKGENYYEYRARKRSQRPSKTDKISLLFSAVFFALSGAFLSL